MKYANCPGCNALIEEDCEGCLRGGSLVHYCEEGQAIPEVFDNVTWRNAP